MSVGRSEWSSRIKATGMQVPKAQVPGARLDFHRAASHLSQKKPGYYLILLRNELRHRSLRRKYDVENEG